MCKFQGKIESNKLFVIIFDNTGFAERILFKTFGVKTESNDEPIQHSQGSFLYHPFDFPEYTAIGWKNVSRSSMERIMGKSFSPTSFESSIGNEKLDNFPETWSVMF